MAPRNTTIAVLVALALLAPAAAATVTTTGTIAGRSVPFAAQRHVRPVELGPGDTMTATLVYDGGGVADLDLALYPPFYTGAAIVGDVASLDLAPTGHYLAQRVGRTTCTDAVAWSQGHLGSDGGVESFTLTLPRRAESGSHNFVITAFHAVLPVSYTLTVTVLDADGRDVTESRSGALDPPGSAANPYAYCDAGVRDLAS